MRLLVAGDTHGNTAWCHALAHHARHHDCSRILQLGDFGYWPRRPEVVETFLDPLDQAAVDLGVEWYFIDGNHDDLEVLRSTSQDATAPVPVGRRLFHIPRGHTWTMAGRRFGALGGACTVDARFGGYTAGENWFPELEQVTEDDLDHLGGAGLDVLVCHDAPPGMPLEGFDLPPEVEAMAQESRERIARAIAANQPALVLHGHWHQRHSAEYRWVDHVLSDGADDLAWRSLRVEGLAADVQGDWRSWLVLDLPELDITEPGRI